MGKLAAFLDRWSLGLGIGSRFRRGVRDLLGVDRMNVVDWRDHWSGLLRDRIGGGGRSFRGIKGGLGIFGKSYRSLEEMR